MSVPLPAADEASTYSVFVGDLAPEVNDFLLQETFRQFYPSVRSAKVITDPSTGRSKGYGFVRFASEPERDRALEMQGFNLSGRPIRVSLATARRTGGSGGSGGADSVPHPADLDPTNTTLFIGGLSAGVSEDQLRAIFGQYGDIVYTKIPAGKGCGFVQFVERPAAEVAMASLNGQIIGANAIRISWGRSTSRAPAARGVGGAAVDPYGAATTAAGAGAYGLVAGGNTLVGGYSGAAGFGAPGAFPGYNGASMLAGAANGGAFGPSGAPMVTGVGLLGAQQQHQQMALGGGLGFGQTNGAPFMNGFPQGMQFDPAAAGGFDKLNAAFVARQQQLLNGRNFLLPRP